MSSFSSFQVEGEISPVFLCVFRVVGFVSSGNLPKTWRRDRMEIYSHKGAGNVPVPRGFPPPGPHLFHEVPERPVSSSEWPSWDQKTRPVFLKIWRNFDYFPTIPAFQLEILSPPRPPVGNPGYSLHVNTQMPWKILYRSSLAERNRVCMYVYIYTRDYTRSPVVTMGLRVNTSLMLRR